MSVSPATSASARQRQAACQPAPRHAALDQVNVVLSLVVGLEDPVGGRQRPLLERVQSDLQPALTLTLAL